MSHSWIVEVTKKKWQVYKEQRMFGFLSPVISNFFLSIPLYVSLFNNKVIEGGEISSS